MLRARVPGREPDGPVVQPLYRERIESGVIVHDATGLAWRYAPRWVGDPNPWVVVCADE